MTLGPIEDAARAFYQCEYGENNTTWEELDEQTKQWYREAVLIFDIKKITPYK